MRVYELIEQLEKFPQHYDVRVEHGAFSLDVGTVESDHGSVILSDCIQIAEDE